MAETVKKLTSVCSDCGEEASFTKRTTKDDAVQLIGDLDAYKAVCRRCFYTSEKMSVSTNETENVVSPISDSLQKSGVCE